jgi:uncharacterized membrane protein (UPF0127 family)
MILMGLSVRAAGSAALFSFLVAMACMPATLLAQATFKKDQLTLKTSSGDHVITVELALTEEQKSLGLMFRPKVPQGTGMLFPYDSPRELTMWMKNTYASLDMIFIRQDGIVHRIEYSTQPMSERVISSNGNVTAVLELAAGEAKRLGVKPGDRVVHATFQKAR